MLLDEYQDTNHAQAILMERVFGGGHPVTAVGDPDQNIYAWRGASLHNLLRFQMQFPKADGTPSEKLPLYTNFRSGARILEAADQILGPLPDEQRPDPGKLLRPWEQSGEGHVEVAQLEHEVSEAEAMARRIVELHAAGLPWKEMAVLCRTHRLFEPLRLAFADHKVPAEFIGLAGLVNLPEVVDVLAYARAAADPAASVALARILMGPRYRVGYRDLARVAAWARRSGFELRDRLRAERLDEDEDLLEDQPFLIAEALEHLEEVDGLSDEGRDRLREFAAELADLREAARRPVGEFLAEIIRRTGLLAELEAEVDVAMATARRRNLSAFLDQVHAFQPLEGEPTLGAFLSYVDSIDDDREWNPAQPSEDDSVKVMTVHMAKGLEFEAVFVPGLARGLFPDTRIQQNPARKGSSLDIELRRDRELMPEFTGTMSAFTDALRRQEEYEERRTAYVALTRAKRHLFASSAVWYGDNLENAKNVGKFFVELMAWARRTGKAETRIEEADEERNPLDGYRRLLLRPWPGPALRPEADDLFPQGWRRAAVEAAETGGIPGYLLGALDGRGREAYEELAAGFRAEAAHLMEAEGAPAEPLWLPPTVSVANVIDYARCPKRFWWTVVRPLPRFSGPAARIGTEVHRWIELQSQAQVRLLEIDEAPDLTDEELAGLPGRTAELRNRFLESRLARLVPLHVERPFILSVDRFRVAGRIDAIYGVQDGPWEVVDYKTGRRPPDDDVAGLQLDLYALACIDVWGKRPENLTLTYLYLASGEEVTRPAGDPEEVRARVTTWLRGVADGRFDPAPSERCRWCDFLPFCDPGRAAAGEGEGLGDPKGYG